MRIFRERQHSSVQTAVNLRSFAARIVEALPQSTRVLSATSPVLINMASVVVTLKIMPESPDSDLSAIETEAMKDIVAMYGKIETRSEKIPIAFGLSSLNLKFVIDESRGSTEVLERKLEQIPHVNSVEVIDVRRAIG